MKKVSIILPTYSGAKFLKASVESCLSQSYPELELIVVDDHSPEDARKVLSGIKDPRLSIVRHEKNLGLPASLNTGFSASTGEYLTWTSDDNYYGPDALRIMAGYLERHRKISMVYTDYYIVNENGKVTGRTKAGPPSMLNFTNIVGACFLYRRDVYEILGGYDTTLPLVEDYDYWLRVKKLFRLGRAYSCPYFFRVHPGSLTALSAGTDRLKEAISKLRRKHFRKDFAEYLDARDAFIALSILPGRWKAFRYLLFHPGDLKTAKMFALAMLPEKALKAWREYRAK